MSLLTQVYAIFLTTKPMHRRLSEAQREWLQILPLQDIADAELDVDISYTDSTTDTTTVSLGSLRQYEAISIATDFSSRDWNSLNPAKTIDTITVSLADYPEDVVVYERWEPQTDNIVELHYFNSLGGIDSFICTGDIIESTQFTRLIGKQFIQEGYLARNGGYYADNQRSRDLVNCVSGYKPADEIKATIDMLHTNKIFRLVTIDGAVQPLPYLYEGDAYEYPAATDNLKGIVFTLRAAWEEKARARVV